MSTNITAEAQGYPASEMDRKTAGRPWRRVTVFVVMAVMLSGLAVVAPVVGDQPSSVAMAGSYPYPNAPDCDEYGSSGCVADQWSFYQGQCTSWVAFRLNDRNGVAFKNTYKQPSGYRWSNASNWVTAAGRAGIRVDTTPAVGAVAWYSNHVAYVEKVNSDGSIVISEMNYDLHNGFRERTVRRGESGWPAKFIHVKDITSSSDWHPPLLIPVSKTIDEPSRYGPSKYIVRRSGSSRDGYGSDSWTTYTVQNYRSADTNYFRWRYTVPGGQGGGTRIQVYIPSRWGYAKAKYKVYVNGRHVESTTVTQANYAARWVTIETRTLKSGDRVMVHLGDRSTSAYGTQLVADAVRLRPSS